MKLSDIRPYERNARNNEKAIPAVMESIKQFGLRGTIGLESPDNPVIVFGHTRVEACKRLGWEEIPDSKVEYCDDLTPEQVKAFRIADNKTGDIATYNKSMLREEMRTLKDFDMSKFGIDFKSKKLPLGYEAMRTDKAYNLDLVNRSDCNARGFPKLRPVMAAPEAFVPFNYAKSTGEDEKKGAACHFFKDDYQFERIWQRPKAYLDALRGFDCVLTPDFLLYLDMPKPMMAWNHYRQMCIGKILQDEGMRVVPTLTWAGEESYSFCFEGIPKHGTVATSTVGVLESEESVSFWKAGMAEALRRIRPKCVLVYGAEVKFDFGDAEVVRYKAHIKRGKRVC